MRRLAGRIGSRSRVNEEAGDGSEDNEEENDNDENQYNGHNDLENEENLEPELGHGENHVHDLTGKAASTNLGYPMLSAISLKVFFHAI
jgi:hypothetical protein